jgi:putative acetyltransferase
MERVETERLILRSIVETDTADIYEYGKEPNVGINAGWQPHKNIEETRKIMHEIFIGQQGVFGMVLKSTGRIIGSIGLIKDPKRENPHAMMLGYAMSEHNWGHGLMTEAAKAVIDYGFRNPDTSIITCTCYTYNRRSRRVIDKCGFKYEGCLRQGEQRFDGQILDIDCFSLLKEEH